MNNDKLDEILGPKEEHPAFGQISITRTSSNRAIPLYGCGIKHTSTIRIRIARSERRRSLHNDRYYASGRLIEIEMSPEQFAEMITSMNCGDGVPCTIRWVGGEGQMPNPDFLNKREQFSNEFKEHTDKVGSVLDDLVALADEMAKKPSVGKGERAEFAKKLALLRQKIRSDTPFLATQFDELMNKIVQEARAEADAFVTNLVQRTGLDSIRRGQVSLGVEESQNVLDIEPSE